MIVQYIYNNIFLILYPNINNRQSCW